MTGVQAYPLTWPSIMPRVTKRESGAFRTSLTAALKNVETSLLRFALDSGKKLDGVVISSNVTLGAQKPDDPGIAVWFTWDGMQVCIAVDRYSKVESNLQAVHHILEARRTELRHGTLALVRATFQGFRALPAPSGSTGARDWRDVLDCIANDSNEAKIAYRALSKKYHPDGSAPDAAKFAELQAAYEQAKKELLA